MIEELKAVLKLAIETKSSEVHVSAGGPLRMRVRGELLPVDGSPTLEPRDAAAIAAEIMRHASAIGACIADPEKTSNIIELVATSPGDFERNLQFQ